MTSLVAREKPEQDFGRVLTLQSFPHGAPPKGGDYNRLVDYKMNLWSNSRPGFQFKTVHMIHSGQTFV